MTNDGQYVPDEEQVRAWCRDAVADYFDVMDEWLDRFLARVKRDAAESTYAAAYRAGWLDGQNGSLPDPRMAYPEETP